MSDQNNKELPQAEVKTTANSNQAEQNTQSLEAGITDSQLKQLRKEIQGKLVEYVSTAIIAGSTMAGIYLNRDSIAKTLQINNIQVPNITIKIEPNYKGDSFNTTPKPTQPPINEANPTSVVTNTEISPTIAKSPVKKFSTEEQKEIDQLEIELKSQQSQIAKCQSEIKRLEALKIIYSNKGETTPKIDTKIATNQKMLAMLEKNGVITQDRINKLYGIGSKTLSTKIEGEIISRPTRYDQLSKSHKSFLRSLLNHDVVIEPKEADLVNVEKVEKGKVEKMEKKAGVAFNKMRLKAAKKGINLNMVSAFRSFDTQTEIFFRGEGVTGPIPLSLIYRDGQDKNIAIIKAYRTRMHMSGAPGFSMHSTGTVGDIGLIDGSFEETAEYKWLKNHAAEFGFEESYPKGNKMGVAFEPWHWRYVGKILKAPSIPTRISTNSAPKPFRTKGN
jgi:LAS superfamily LD-carboxypeptidase LdcB